MKYSDESTLVENFGQLRYHRSTINARGAGLYTSLANRTKFDRPKSVTYAHASEIKEMCRLHIERHNDYGFSTNKPALCVAVLPISCKVKDIVVYRNNRNTVKSANYRSLSRKGPILLSAIYRQSAF